MTSASQIIANRENATKSTGPLTEAGKKASSLNSLKHGLTAQNMILQPHEQEALLRIQNGYMNDLRPRTGLERDLVMKMVDCSLRLSRISTIENNILNLSTLEHIRTEDAQDPLMEFAIAQSRAYLDRANEIDKLSRYQSRITRQFMQYSKELSRLQKERRAEALRHAQSFTARKTAKLPKCSGKENHTGSMASFGQPVSQSSRHTPARPSDQQFIEKKAA